MKQQRGATIIEFTLVLVLFLTFMLGILDFARMLYTWSAANEATRAGARYAAVCDSTGNRAAVLGKMQQLMPQIQNSNLVMTWEPPSCNPSDCVGVTVRLQNLTYRWISPISGIASRANLPMPSFSTHLTRESMRQDPRSGDIC